MALGEHVEEKKFATSSASSLMFSSAFFGRVAKPGTSLARVPTGIIQPTYRQPRHKISYWDLLSLQLCRQIQKYSQCPESGVHEYNVLC